MWFIGICTCPAIGHMAFQMQEQARKKREGVKPALGSLTRVAALPSGAGCMASMKAEEGVGLAKPVETITVWPTLEAFKATVQMKAAYFQEHDELVFPPIDLGEIGGLGA